MKNSLYIIIALTMILSNCTKSNNVELKDKAREQNISDSHETSAQKFDSINSAAYYIFWENFDLRRMEYNKLQDVLLYFNKYRLMSETVRQSIHGNLFTEYIIKGGQYTVMVHSFYFPENYKIYPIGFELNETNYLHLFPYRTMGEYLAADNFGEIFEIKEDAIVYKVPIETFGLCTLKFIGGLLESIEYTYRIA